MDKTFPAAIETLYDMIEYVSRYATENGFNNDIVKNIELVIEEALVNVIVHGYKETPNGQIHIGLNKTPKPGIIITITDEGVPFNPDAYADTPSPLSEKARVDGQEVGGWGLFLIFKMMDKVDYARIDGKNVLKLEKHLVPS